MLLNVFVGQNIILTIRLLWSKYMPPSSLIVTTDKLEYCKYDLSKKIITITATAPSGEITSGDSFLFSIRRTSGYSGTWPEPYADVMKKTIIATSSNASSNTISCTFIIGSDDIDADFIARCISGYYYAQVSVTNSTTIWKSPDFYVSLISTENLRQEWLFGVTLKAIEMMSIKFPPQILTGFSVNEISTQTIPGIKNVVLTYTATPSESWTLSWDGGPAVQFGPSTTPKQILMTDMTNINYVVSTVNTSLLPKLNVNENLLVAESMFTDDLIQSRVRRAIQSTEAFLGFPIEPYLYTSIPAQGGLIGSETYIQEYWDRIARPADYFVSRDVANWPTFRLPYQWCIKLHKLYGFHSIDKILKIDEQWFNTTVDRISGVVTLVPSLASFAKWTVFTHPMLAPFYLHTNLPSFWQYTATIGLPDLENGDRGLVQEFLARTATMSILTDVGRAYQGGLGGESASRDGLSGSRSYNPGGPYATTIQAHQQWIQTEGARIKQRLGGLNVQVLGA